MGEMAIILFMERLLFTFWKCILKEHNLPAKFSFHSTRSHYFRMHQSGNTTPKTKRQGVLSNGRKRWDKEGVDAVYLTKKILSNPQLGFRDFLDEHSNWLERYKRENFYKHSITQQQKSRILQGENGL